MKDHYSVGEELFNDVQNAVIRAREKAKIRKQPVAVWLNRTLVIAVVTDDADGLTVHRLKTWPKDLECAYV